MGKEQEETEKEKAADSFVNDVSEAEGRQEPCVEPEKEEKQEEGHSEPEDGEEEEVKPGVLTVHVIEASNLLNKDIMGKSDPYVEISFEETKVKSSTVTNSLSPQWNFISNFDVTGDDTSSIKFSVFDADYGKDQLLGSCSISIKDALSELDSARWISLEEPESGKISIKFGFTEKQDQNEEEEQEETKEYSKEAADSYANEVSEEEGRQEPTVEPEKEEEQEETKEDKAADSFINDVSEAEGRQEPTVEPEKEEEQEETKESNNEVTECEKGIFKLKKNLETEDQDSGSQEAESPIEIIGEIKEENNKENENEKEQETEEGRQEPTVEPEKEEEQIETMEEKTADSFINDVSEAEG